MALDPLRLVAVAGCLLLSAADAKSQLYPGRISPLPTAGFGAYFASGDLNGDGITDLLAGLDSDTVRVLLGNGQGGLMAAVNVAAPPGVILHVGDVTGDGHVDLLYGLDPISVLPGTGTGAFGAPFTVLGGVPSWSLAVGDVNGDGPVDVVLHLGNSLLVLPGDGAGAFGTPVPLAVPGLGSSAPALALVDLDDDGDLDLAVGSFDSPAAGAVLILVGDGLGGFASAGQVPVGAYRANSATAADVNGDGDVDLVVASSTATGGQDPATVTVCLGDGTGALTIPQVIAFANAIEDVLLHDDDHDGDFDLFASQSGALIARLANDGSGEFGAPSAALPGGVPCFGRFDGDALDDVAIFDWFSSGVVIAPGLPVGGFLVASIHATGSPFVFGVSTVAGVAVADVDGDGNLDILTGTLEIPGKLSVLFGDGAGGLGPPSLTPYGWTVEDIAVGDLDEDGLPDAVVSTSVAPELAVFFGAGSGAFSTPVANSLPVAGRGVLATDMNGDGHLDSVCSLGAASPGLAVLSGDGTGALSGPVVTGSPGLGGPIVVADMDHDGHVDVLGITSSGVRILLGDGDGGVASSSDHAVGAQVRDLAVADVNLDGNTDVVTALGVGSVGVLLGDGAGGLLPAVLHPAGNGSFANSLCLADVSGDGLADLVLPRDQQDRFFVLVGDGAGGFSSESAGYMAGFHPSPVAIGDFDGDSHADVVCCLSASVSLSLNIETSFAWTDLGQGLASGSVGPPQLAGTGTLLPGEPVKLTLSGARPLAPAWLLVGVSILGLPFKGGTLVPDPSLVVLAQTDSDGTLILQGPMPFGTPSGVAITLQSWIADPAGPSGASASNALSALTP